MENAEENSKKSIIKDITSNEIAQRLSPHQPNEVDENASNPMEECKNDSAKKKTTMENNNPGTEMEACQSTRRNFFKLYSNDIVNQNDELENNSGTDEEEFEYNAIMRRVNSCLQKNKPKPNWRITRELAERELGYNNSFRQKFYGSLHAVERLELMHKMDEHKGCVNTLNFNRKGNLLASGADDLKIIIWDWKFGKKYHEFHSGHRNNVFSVKWIPMDPENLIATGGLDGELRMMDFEYNVSRKLTSHREALKCIAVHPESPHEIISVGEDTLVKFTDIRVKKSFQKFPVINYRKKEVPLYCVNINPLKSNEFCVVGESQFIFVYDKRNVPEELYELHPPKMFKNDSVNISSAVYNYNGTEILVSCNDEAIYLFDIIPKSHTVPDNECLHKYEGHKNSATVKGVNFFGPKSEYIVSGSDCGNIFIWDKNTEAIVQWMPGDERGTVNCLQPHPHIPILATSGLDTDVKIWIPSCENSPKLDHLKQCIKSNFMDRKNHPKYQRPLEFWIGYDLSMENPHRELYPMETISSLFMENIHREVYPTETTSSDDYSLDSSDIDDI